MNSIVFLGTAGDVEVMARQQLASGGLVLDLEGNQFHLDPGPGALSGMKAAGLSARETIAVLVSNDSVLRSNDVNACVSAMTLDGIDKHGVLLGSHSVIEGDNSIIRSVYKRCVEGLVALNPGQKVGINEVTIMPMRTAGQDETGVGFRFSTEKVALGYVGDTRWYETIAHDYKGCNVLIINVKHPAGTSEEGFLNTEEAEALIMEVKPKIAYLTSYGSKLVTQDLRDLARQMQRRTKVDVTAAKDGQKAKLPVLPKTK
ncbi:hypothetical protein GOV07_02200 [Candidatus Woesearchaeota archaeon]|nr:hypothetical protein [Candidatus Woesearchaeota archaeon]